MEHTCNKSTGHVPQTSMRTWLSPHPTWHPLTTDSAHFPNPHLLDLSLTLHKTNLTTTLSSLPYKSNSTSHCISSSTTTILPLQYFTILSLSPSLFHCMCDYPTTTTSSMATLYNYFLFFSSLCLISIATISESAHQFQVGGPAGWTQPTGKENETYNQWAAKHRFHVGDSLCK